MAIERARFGDNFAAYLHHLGSLNPAEAVPALTNLLRDGSWAKESDAWSSAAFGLHNRNQWPSHQLYTEFAAALSRFAAAEDEPVVHRHFPFVLYGLAREPSTECKAAFDELISWFTRVGRPGDARVAANGLIQCEHATDVPEARAELLRRLAPLAAWLLENGGAVLRGESADVLQFLAEITLDCDPERVTSVLQYARVSERPVGFSPPRKGSASPFVFWPAIELALKQGTSSSLVWDLVERQSERGWSGLEELLPCLEQSLLQAGRGWLGPEAMVPSLEQPFPRSRAALFHGLVRGRFGRKLEARWWPVLFRFSSPPSPPINFTDLETASEVLEHLKSFSLNSGLSEGVNLVPWFRLLVFEYLRLLDFTTPRSELEAARTRLMWMTGFSAMAAGVREGLQAALQTLGSVQEAALALELLEQSQSDAATRAALAVLPAATSRPRTVDAPDVAELRPFLERFLHLPWPHAVGGADVGALLGRARRLEFQALTGDDKVRLEGELVTVDIVAMEGIAKEGDAERRRMLAALYFFHELIHLAQGIGDKDRVSRLRSTGAESSLLHLDLAADHVASLLAHEAVPHWSVQTLKAEQARSLKSFPVRWMHTAASGARKAQRLVSIRFDSLARAEPNVARRLGEGYAFVDYGPGGGRLFALSGGSLRAVIGDTQLRADEAKLLAASADVKRGTDADMAAIDVVLMRLLKSVE